MEAAGAPAPAEPAKVSKETKLQPLRQEKGAGLRRPKGDNHNIPNELHAALEQCDWRLCKSLVHAKPSLLSGKNKNGYTPLMLLAMADWAAPDASVDGKSLKDAANEVEYRKLVEARKRNFRARQHAELLESMLEKGAKTAAKKADHKSAADFAQESGKEHLAARLRGLEIAIKRPAWRWEMLDSFPRRATTLDQHAQMSHLSAELLQSVSVYLTHRFPSSTPEVALALRWVWENHPTSLRVKEFFETLETFGLIAQEIALIRSRGAQEICLPCNGEDSSASLPGEEWSGVNTIFDMACGHGLLGILLAYRFPEARVVCVDLQRRESFDHYIAAFRACGVLDVPSGETEVLQNVEFVEGDMASLVVPPQSFVVCVHACNEANRTAVQMARRAGAGYGVIPCCIPDGLYSVRGVRHVDDDTRYAAMVGVMAGTFGAHTIVGIERRITNRHMALLGGYPCEKRTRNSANSRLFDDKRKPEPLAWVC